MKKLVILAAMGVAALGLMGSICDPPPDPGDFSIELLGDTTATVDSLGASADFHFKITNNTANPQTLTIHFPDEKKDLPPNWFITLCFKNDEGGGCYPAATAELEIDANSSSDEHYVTIYSGTEGSEGMITLECSGTTEEVDEQVFTMKIAE